MIEVAEREPEQDAVPISVTCWRLGNVSPTHVRNLEKKGLLDFVHIGRRTFVTNESIKRFLAAGGTAKPKARVRHTNGKFVQNGEGR